MPDANAWFEWGISGRPSVVYETQHRGIARSGNILDDFDDDIVGLAPSTQYFYRMVVENGRGKDYGQTVYLTTKNLKADVIPLAIVETNTALEVTETSMMMRGYVSPHGDNDAKAWFEWGVTSRLEGQTQPHGISENAEYVKDPLTNLSPGTTYYYRAVAQNASGITYGAVVRVRTLGTPPPSPEREVSQALPKESKNNDGIARTTTTSGLALATKQNGGGLFDMFATNKSGAGSANTNTSANASANTNPNTSTKNSDQVATVASGPVGQFFSSLLGVQTTDVIVEKVGPSTVPMHTPVEYRITYHYREQIAGKNAKLKIIVPAEVVYIGDNTNNELLLEEGDGGERTYILPIGGIVKGETRTVSVLGMTTGNANGFPDARARLEYTVGGVVHVIAAAGKVAGGTTSSANTNENTSGGILPHSLLGWLVYIALIIGLIVGSRKGMAYYEKRKAEILAQKERDSAASVSPTLEAA
jgi:hypothetical protein